MQWEHDRGPGVQLDRSHSTAFARSACCKLQQRALERRTLLELLTTPAESDSRNAQDNKEGEGFREFETAQAMQRAWIAHLTGT